jgi:hypothetical protein
MAENKTQPNDADPRAFLASLEDPKKRADSEALLAMMERITGEVPVMYGDSIVGFGRYQYRYASGREGEWFRVGFSPRKQSLTLYLMTGFDEYEELLRQVGKVKTGKACLYVKRLSDVDQDALETLIRASYESEAMGES